jgi:hypothetical protein
MEKTIILNNGTKVSMKTGSEGPNHDPYSFIEYKIENMTIHLGLAEFIKVNKVKVAKTYKECESWLLQNKNTKLEDLIQEIEDALHQPKPCKCGCKEATWRSGFPGEHLLICDNCKDVLDSEFCESEII